MPRAHYEWLAISHDLVTAPGLTSESVILNPFPMVNMASIGGILLPWLRTGCVLVQHHPFDLSVFLTQVATERITYTIAPPALLALLLQREELLATADISTLRTIGSGSAPLQEWMVRGWYEKHGISIINYFGSNEGIALMSDVEVMTDPAQRAAYFPNYASDVRWSFTTAARTDVRLVDPATGADVTEPGVPGELRMRGPSVFAGYLDPSQDAFDEQGFLKTGDVFVIEGRAQRVPALRRPHQRPDHPRRDEHRAGGSGVVARQPSGHCRSGGDRLPGRRARRAGVCRRGGPARTNRRH